MLGSMANGKYKRISKIKEGDKILTFDESTKEYSQGTVTDFLTHEVNNLIPAISVPSAVYQPKDSQAYTVAR